jgi:hypothetical protein
VFIEEEQALLRMGPNYFLNQRRREPFEIEQRAK